MLPALIRQSHDADYFLVRELPDPAGRAPGAKSRPFAELKNP
jgi:hypothetical protein